MSDAWYYEDPRCDEKSRCDCCKQLVYCSELAEFGEDSICDSCWEERGFRNLISLEKSITEEEYEIFELVNGGSDNA